MDNTYRIKIAFVLWSLSAMGGSEKVVYDIARKIDKTRFDPIIIAYEDGPIRSLYAEIGIKTFVIVKKAKYDYFKFITQIRKVLTSEKVDIVNAHHFSPLLYSYMATRLSKIKVVYTEHSRWQIEQLSFVKKIINRIILAGTEATVAISNQIYDYYLNKLKLNRKHVFPISNGIEIEAFQITKNNKMRKKLGIAATDLIIGIVANIRPEKNHKLLISVFSKLQRLRENVKLLIVGKDLMNGEVHSFAQLSECSNKIIFLGKRDDIPELISCFDIFCLPSLYEGLPISVLEAMATCVPVVGSDVVGINEVIRHNTNGLLFPSNDRDKLLDCLLVLIDDHKLRQRIANTGRQYVEKNYSIDEKIVQYEELFRQI